MMELDGYDLTFRGSLGFALKANEQPEAQSLGDAARPPNAGLVLAPLDS